MQTTETATDMMNQVLAKLAETVTDAGGQALVSLARNLMKDRAIVQAELNGTLAINLASFDHLNIMPDGPTEDQADDYRGFIHAASMVS